MEVKEIKGMHKPENKNRKLNQMVATQAVDAKTMKNLHSLSYRILVAGKKRKVCPAIEIF